MSKSRRLEPDALRWPRIFPRNLSVNFRVYVKTMRRTLAAVILIVCLASCLEAQNRPEFQVIRAIEPPKIDGILNDAVWTQDPLTFISAFTASIPNPTRFALPSVEETTYSTTTGLP
jgi:hypothetical protein